MDRCCKFLCCCFYSSFQPEPPLPPSISKQPSVQKWEVRAENIPQHLVHQIRCQTLPALTPAEVPNDVLPLSCQAPTNATIAPRRFSLEACSAADTIQNEFLNPLFPSPITKNLEDREEEGVETPLEPIIYPENASREITKMYVVLRHYGKVGLEGAVSIEYQNTISNHTVKEVFKNFLLITSPWNQMMTAIRNDLRKNARNHPEASKQHQNFVTFVETTLTQLILSTGCTLSLRTPRNSLGSPRASFISSSSSV